MFMEVGVRDETHSSTNEGTFMCSIFHYSITVQTHVIHGKNLKHFKYSRVKLQ